MQLDFELKYKLVKELVRGYQDAIGTLGGWRILLDGKFYLLGTESFTKLAHVHIENGTCGKFTAIEWLGLDYTGTIQRAVAFHIGREDLYTPF